MAWKTSCRFLLPLFALVHTVLALDCPSGWDGYGNSCYKFVVQTSSVRGLNWENARRDCLGYGGDLVSIADKSEMSFVYGKSPKDRNQHYWIGLNDRRNERQFVWSDGTPYNGLVYSNWYPGEPNDRAGEDCVELYNKRWNDNSCKKEYGYICKRPKAPIACPVRWVFYSSSCYKFSSHRKKWIDAKKDCRASGGYLLKIDDADEQHFITYKQSASNGASWIGLSDSAVEGSYGWESDNSLVNYTHWDTEEPNDFAGVEDCVAVGAGASAGFWNDDYCDSEKYFICEKPGGINQCDSPFGMQDGNIADSQISASSSFNMSTLASQARLLLDSGYLTVGAWCAAQNNVGEYLQIDLGVVRQVKHIALQGRPRSKDFVKTFYLKCGNNGLDFNSFGENATVKYKILSGNFDAMTIRNIILTEPINARFIRIYPLTWNSHICIRTEIYGCASQGKLPGPYIEYVKLEGSNGSTAYTGSTVNLTCKAQDYNVQNSFVKDNSPIKEGDQKHYEYFHMKDRDKNVKILNLEIKNARLEDAGNYSCYAVLGNGLRTFETFHLKVVNLTATCPQGYYCPLGSVRPIQCPWGTYQPQVGQSSLRACKQCPDFMLNLSKPDPSYTPVANITDCVEGNPPTEVVEDKQPLPSNHITSVEMIGIVSGVLGMVFMIVLLFYCFVKKCWLTVYSSSSRTTNQHDPESLPCEPVFPNGDCQLQGLCENMQDAEFAQVVKKAPEIDYEPKYDVFICYSYKDVNWVKELFTELEKQGFTCCIDFKDFVPGAPIVENISQAICSSRKTIAVLTPDFVESDWCSHELQKALTRIRFHQVVPVVYKSCEIPLILRDRTYLDWENCHVKPYFWDQLEKALKQPNDGVI